MCGRRTCILAVTRRNDSPGRPARGGKPQVDGAPERRTIFDMPGKVNHRGWIVLTSVSSADGAYCVDLFEDPNGGYGFEHFRSEPEDNGRWTPVGAFGGARFSSAAEAGRAASVAVYWVAQDRRARTMLNDYLGG